MSADSAQHLEFGLRIVGPACMSLHAEDNADMRVRRYRYASHRPDAVLRPELNEERIAMNLVLRDEMASRERLAIEEIAALRSPDSQYIAGDGVPTNR